MRDEIIAAVFSGTSLILGVYLWNKGSYLIQNGIKAKGVVYTNNFKDSPTSSRTGMYFPVIRFMTESREWITQELEIGYNPPKPEGSKVKILYDPEDPNYIQMDSPLVLVFLPRILVGIGFIGFILSLLIYTDLINLV